MSGKKRFMSGSWTLIAFLIILLLEAAFDGIAIRIFGGWSLLFLPFLIFVQVVFDFAFIGLIVYFRTQRSSKTRVIN